MRPRSSTQDEASRRWLRVLEVSVGVSVLVLGVALWWPGLHYGLAFYAALAIGLIVLELLYITRTCVNGSMGGLLPNLVLSVLAILFAMRVLAAPSYHAVSSYHAVNLLAAGVLFAGTAHVAFGTANGKAAGIGAMFITLVVFVSPHIRAVLVILATPIEMLFSDFYYSEIPAALVTLSLMILALEPLATGIRGRAS